VAHGYVRHLKTISRTRPPARQAFARGPYGAILWVAVRLRSIAAALALLGGTAVLACGAPSIEGDPLPISVPDRIPGEDGGAPDGGAVPDDPLLDAGPTDPGATDGGGTPDANRMLRAFVSSAVLSGNLGGLAGADATCNSLAKAQGLAGTYRAWLSVAGSNAVDRITADGPWYLVNGELVASTRAELVSGTLRHAIDRDEKGATPPAAEDRVWTATTQAGAYVGPDCGGWTGAGNGVVGEAEQRNGTWTALTPEACGEVNRVYCFGL